MKTMYNSFLHPLDIQLLLKVSTDKHGKDGDGNVKEDFIVMISKLKEIMKYGVRELSSANKTLY